MTEVTEVLSYKHGPRGTHPAAWSYRPGEHARKVLMPGTLAEVTLATSWHAVDKVLTSPDAVPWVPDTASLIGHSARGSARGSARDGDVNTLPPGPEHDALRHALRPLGDARNWAGLDDVCTRMAGRLDLRQPTDLVAGYIVPLIDLLARRIGFPGGAEWQQMVLAPTRATQSLATPAGGMTAMHAQYVGLLTYCRGLEENGRVRAHSVLDRARAALRSEGAPPEIIWRLWRVLATGGPTPEKVLWMLFYRYLTEEQFARPYREHPALREHAVAEAVRLWAHYGLMNGRTMLKPARLDNGTWLDGIVIPVLHAALTDEDEFPHAGQYDLLHALTTAPWGWGRHGCPAFRLSWAFLLAVMNGFTTVWPRARLATEPVILDDLLPHAPTLMVVSPS
jgi:hypothetical protein